jgi:hypothetical protein
MSEGGGGDDPHQAVRLLTQQRRLGLDRAERAADLADLAPRAGRRHFGESVGRPKAISVSRALRAAILNSQAGE